jgi:uncharacterized protein (DUF433 family)
MIAISYPHLEIDPSGVARIEGTRYKVSHLAAEHYVHGWTAEELLRQHPDLSPGQVYAALTYFHDHYDRMVGDLKAGAMEAEEAALRSGPPSRSELLARRNTVS